MLVFLAPDARPGGRDNFDVSTAAPPTAPTSAESGVAVARAPGRGVPSLMWTARGEPPAASLSLEAAARAQLVRHASAYGVTPAVLAGARTRYVHDTGRGGIIVALRQTVGGVDLFHGDIKLLLDRSRRLLAISGSPHPAAHPGAAQPFRLAPETAIAAALRDLHGDAGSVPLVELDARSGWRRYAVAGDRRLRFREPARARPVYLPVGDAVTAAHLVELQTELGAREDVYQYIVAADDGRLLMRRNATAHQAYQYRVYAADDPLRSPLDSPIADFSPHPTGVPGPVPDGFESVVLVAIDGLNTNPDGEPDPWLPADALATVGNNVDAYSDPSDDNPIEDRIRATVSAPGVFDYTYDVAAPVMVTDAQTMAAITSSFYIVNWLHDWWYDSGFVEATGAGQIDNYGRGGEDGDPLLIENQHGVLVGQRNNASMTTPLDGASGRMLLRYYQGPSEVVDLSVQPLAQSFTARVAMFSLPEFDVTAPLVRGEDTGGTSQTDGCQAPVGDVQGAVLLLDGGGCPTESKAKRALEAGAAGILVIDEAVSEYPPVFPSDVWAIDPNLPSVGITQAAGDVLGAALAEQAQTVHLAAKAGQKRDSALDAMLIAHEFGHFLHHRLGECGTQSCWAESEGWGDFLGLLLSARAGDDLDGVFLSGIWANREETAYFNGRRFANSTDPAYNALSFRHISDGAVLPEGTPIFRNGIPNSEVHNAGEVWVAMLWDSYVALQRLHEGELEFDGVRRLMSDYVVAAMMLAPPDPTYTEQRDALLMAIAATSEADMLAVAEAFAGRGAGSCAVSPPRYSLDLAGVVEDFELRGRGAIVSATIDDGLESCDHDGVIDRDELGRLEVVVLNSGMAPLPAGTTLEVVAPPAGLVFPDGPVVAVPELAPMQQHTVTIPVAVDDDLDAPTRVALDLRLTVSDACEETAERRVHAHVQADLAAAGATVDDVEAGSAWTLAGDFSDAVWSRVSTSEGHVWQGANVSHVSDTSLVSPPFTVAKDQDFVIRLDHAYSFDDYGTIPYDGGVIELSADDGATWHDLGQVIGQTGYNGEIDSLDNKLDGRDAFVRKSSGYPALKPLVLEFGEALAGLTMRLRFRIGTGAQMSGPGWTIDNLSFEGLVDAPFPRWVADAAACAPADPTGQEEPTTGGTDITTTGPVEDSDTDGGAPDTSGADAEDAGCGCVTDPRGAGWFVHACALFLLALRRRRSPR